MPPPPRCFNHNPVTGDALRRVLPPQSASPPTRGHNTKGRDALRRVHVHSSHKSGIGPTRDVPAPPSARGVRTREVATCYDRPGDRPAHNMKSTPASGRLTRSRAETRGHGGFLELVYAHLNHAACNLHGLVAKPRLRQAQPSRIFAKQHRFTDLRMDSLVATAIAMVLQVPLHGKKKPDRAKHLLSRPLLCRPKGVSVCSVVKNTLPRRTPRG